MQESYGLGGRLAAELFRAGLCGEAFMAREFPLLSPVFDSASAVLSATAMGRDASAPRSLPLAVSAPRDPDFARVFFGLLAAASPARVCTMTGAARTGRAMQGWYPAALLDRIATIVCSATGGTRDTLP
jgi:hypothetical protein